MTSYEKAVVIGLYRQGATWREIGAIIGISPAYAKQVVREYLESKGEKINV